MRIRWNRPQPTGRNRGRRGISLNGGDNRLLGVFDEAVHERLHPDVAITPQPLCMVNDFNLVICAVELGVDDHVVIFGPVGDLSASPGETPANDIWMVLRAGVKPLGKRSHARRQDEYAHRVSGCFTGYGRGSALPVDVKQYCPRPFQRRHHRSARSSIQMLMDFSPFEEGSVANLNVELGL